MSEMNNFDHYTDDQVEAILNGYDVSDEDFALASFIAEARAIATEPVDAELARRQVRMLAEAALLTSSNARSVRKVEGDRSDRATPDGIFIARRRRLLTKAAVVGLAAVLMGGGIASAATGNLPAPAQEALANLAARLGIELPNPARPLPHVAGPTTADVKPEAAVQAANAGVFTTAVQETIDEYTSALKAWAACVASNASERGTTQRGSATRTAGPFDPTAGCDPKPQLDVPNPVDFDLTETGTGAGGAEEDSQPADHPNGPPADNPNGPPPDTGPPAGLP